MNEVNRGWLTELNWDWELIERGLLRLADLLRLPGVDRERFELVDINISWIRSTKLDRVWLKLIEIYWSWRRLAYNGRCWKMLIGVYLWSQNWKNFEWSWKRPKRCQLLVSHFLTVCQDNSSIRRICRMISLNSQWPKSIVLS